VKLVFDLPRVVAGEEQERYTLSWNCLRGEFHQTLRQHLQAANGGDSLPYFQHDLEVLYHVPGGKRCNGPGRIGVEGVFKPQHDCRLCAQFPLLPEDWI